MNILFSVIFLVCTILLFLCSPETFLEALLNGASKGATFCVSLLASYAVWLGLMRVWEDSGVARGVSKLLKPVARRLLKTDDDQALNAACMNFSVNLLGISGAATPYGIKAANLLDKTDNAEYASAMLFVLNATSLQIFPASMVAVRVAMQSAAPNDIILPTFLTTVFSTLLAVILTKIFIKPDSMKKRATPPRFSVKKYKRTGAGI